MKKQEQEAINTMRLQGKAPSEIAWTLGDLCEYSPLSYSPPPGTGRWQTLQELR